MPGNNDDKEVKSTTARVTSSLSSRRSFLDSDNQELVMLRRQSLVAKGKLKNIFLKTLPVQLREAAVMMGLPQMISQATSISTARWQNTVGFRSSDPIPLDLYRDYLEGEARPKAITQKAKSATIGPQAGYAVKDNRHGAYKKNPATGQFYLRQDEVPTGLEENQLKTSLRSIWNELGKKYEVVPPEEVPNPVEKTLYFRQINHPHPEVANIIYSLNLKEEKKIKADTLKNFSLITKQLATVVKDPKEGVFFDNTLDSCYNTYVQHPGDEKPAPLIILGKIVRDCDLDFISDPPKKLLVQRFGDDIDVDRCLQPVAMEDSPVAEEKSVNAKADVLTRLYDMHQRSWYYYNKEKNKHANDPRWELDNIHLKPIIPQNITKNLLASMVVTVGKGTPMEMYQSLEINLLGQALLKSKTSPKDGIPINLYDLESDDPKKANLALYLLLNQELEVSEEVLARSFIQHCSECFNEYYTNMREMTVVISGHNNISINDDKKTVELMEKPANQQYIAINQQWILENSVGNQNAAIWVQHYLRTHDWVMENKTHAREYQELKSVVNDYLLSPKNKEFLTEQMHSSNNSTQNYLREFFTIHPEIKASLESEEKKFSKRNG